MRCIKLKQTGEFYYADIINTLVSAPQSSGYNIQEVRKAVKILDKVATTNGELYLEEDEYEFLRDKVENAKYTVANKQIIAFVDDILNVPSYDFNGEDDDRHHD